MGESPTDAPVSDGRLVALEERLDRLEADNAQLRRVLAAAGALLADRDLSVAEPSSAVP